MPNVDRLLPTLDRAIAAFQATPGRRGRLVELVDVDDVLVAGDLHGHVENLKRILELAALKLNPRRHLVLQELIHGPFRYPARPTLSSAAPEAGVNEGGDKSHQMLDLLAALKCEYPNRVHMLLGNHELSQWTGRAIMKAETDLNDLFKSGVQTAYGERANEVYAAYERLIGVLPIALRTPNRVFLSHSLVGGSRLGQWEMGSLIKDVFEPSEFKLGGPIHAIVWGRDTSAAAAEHFLRKVDADWLVTGHIPCDDGYQTPNPRQVILDCKDDNGCSCLFPATRPLTVQDLLCGIIRLRTGKLPEGLQPSS